MLAPGMREGPIALRRLSRFADRTESRHRLVGAVLPFGNQHSYFQVRYFRDHFGSWRYRERAPA